ncbi:MAG: universal stress protein [Nitrospiraceae bacterium]|nr:universal stress protein [Nitrospiraceae bacterium]
MFRKILVAFDGSPKAYEAFDYAIELALMSKPASCIVVLSVVQPPESLYFVEMSDVINGESRHYEELLGELAEKAKKKDLEVETKVAIGHPAGTIVQTAKEKGCDLIVIGHKGKSMLEGLLLGSVSRRVASEATCSVTIVK